MARGSRATMAALLAGGLAVTLLLALVVSGFASGEPDGLERVAEDEGFADTAEDHALADGPLADYAVRGVDNERLSTGLSGVTGVAVTFALGAGLFTLFRRRTHAAGGQEAHMGSGPGEPGGRSGPGEPGGRGAPGGPGGPDGP
jgi:hypothetical protein